MQLHFATFVIHYYEWFQQDVILDQQGTPQYTYNLNDKLVQLEVVFDDINDTVGDDCNVYRGICLNNMISHDGLKKILCSRPLRKVTTGK